jgi:hypothetical protein
MKYSFWLLELSVEPGGAQRNELLAGDLAIIQRFLENDLADFYLPITYGQKMTLTPFFAGEAQAAIDLHPYIRYIVDGKRVTFDDRHRAIHEDGRIVGPLDALPIEDENGDLLDPEDLALPRDASVEVVVDWKAMPLPALPAPLAPAGAQLFIERYGDEVEAGVPRDFASE